MKLYDALLKFQGFVGDIELILIDLWSDMRTKVRERVAEEESDDRLLCVKLILRKPRSIWIRLWMIWWSILMKEDIVLEILEEFKKNDLHNERWICLFH